MKPNPDSKINSIFYREFFKKWQLDGDNSTKWELLYSILFPTDGCETWRRLYLVNLCSSITRTTTIKSPIQGGSDNPHPVNRVAILAFEGLAHLSISFFGSWSSKWSNGYYDIPSGIINMPRCCWSPVRHRWTMMDIPK